MKPVRLLLVATSALMAASAARAADEPSVVGTWDVVATTPDGELPAVISIRAVDGGIEAEVEIAGAARTVSGEALAANVLTMKVEYEGGVYDVEAKVDGDALRGTWQGAGYSGTLKGKRRSQQR